MKREWLLALVVLIPILAMPAPQHRSQMDGGNQPASPAWLTLEQSMEKMHAAMMSLKTSRNSDVDFVRLMLPHHQAAIDIAKTQLIYGEDDPSQVVLRQGNATSNQ